MVNHTTSRKHAFTLIELLIVITIIGILAVAFIPRLAGMSGRGRDAQRKSDLQQIATALEVYAQDNNGLYPSSTGACISTLGLGSYLTTTPVDPSGSAAIGVQIGSSGAACSGSGYTYRSLNSQTGYILTAELENNSDRAAAGIYTKTSVTGATVNTTTTASTLLSGGTGNFTACTSSASTGCSDVVTAIGR